jgi:SAM-dependent methyltransferase
VTRSADPLRTLADAELPYRFAADAARMLPGDATVIDLGCGEGYLTYALRSAGYRCVGIDLSQTVVDRARKRFGHDDWFATPDRIQERRADLVIALEIIEHVPDPVGFLRDAVKLVKDGGAVVATTPNRDASPAGAIWDTDLPPVHLLWFGAKAITEAGRRAGCDVTFLDTEYRAAASHRVGTWEPLLTADGEPSQAVRRVRGLGWRLRTRAGKALAGRSPFRALPARDQAPAPTLGVAFRPQRITAGRGNGRARHAAPDIEHVPG